jgi:periplasmic copper chaperone A
MLLPWRRSQRAGLAVSRAARCVSAVLAAAIAATAAQAAPPDAKGLVISNPWFRAIMPSRPEAGYFDLANKGARKRELVQALSPDCGTLMLHETVSLNGVDRMVMLHSLIVPAHGDIRFAPGGYHLMCLSPSADATPGNSVPVTLRFRDGATLTASFPVRGATGK